MTLKRILLIDDDGDDRDLFCEALKAVAPDFTCYTAINGRIALSALETGEFEIPDLIFLDINMPVMNGWQVLSALRAQERYRNIPVVIYSTSTYREDIEMAIKYGALCFFTKPYGLTELKKSLEWVTAYLVNDLPASTLKRASLCRCDTIS